jgi:hypothetical protein
MRPSTRSLFRPALALPLLALLVLPLAGCAELQQLAALSRVDFGLDRTSGGVLAGVNLDRIGTYRDISPQDVVQVLGAYQRGEMPLRFTLHMDALNPPDNGVTARLLDLDWTLYLEGKRTIDGRLGREFLLPPGEVVDVPLEIELDLLRFYRDNAQDLADLALSLAGRGGSPKNIELRARPTIGTPLGPIQYPEEITITSRTLGR